jgi:hypothetical protein
MAIASFILSVISISLTGYISWDRWHSDKRPTLQISYEDYGDMHPDTPFLEIANVGSEDLKRVEIELRGTLIGYVPVALTLFEDQMHATGETKKVGIGALAPLDAERVRFRRNRIPVAGSEDKEYYPAGSVNLYAHCRGRWWSRWRVPVAIHLDSYEPMQ